MPEFSAAQIAEKLNGQILGDPALKLHGFAPADSAKQGELTFAENESYFLRADQSAAAVLVVRAGWAKRPGQGSLSTTRQ